MDNIVMAIVLRQIHMLGVEYILDDQTINSSKCGVVSLVFTIRRSYKKWAVVSEQHYFGYCTPLLRTFPAIPTYRVSWQPSQ